jgi:hypothetical protein
MRPWAVVICCVVWVTGVWKAEGVVIADFEAGNCTRRRFRPRSDGGHGHRFGTLIGALIIAVIENAMNLTNVETYEQKVLGGVILGSCC